MLAINSTDIVYSSKSLANQTNSSRTAANNARDILGWSTSYADEAFNEEIVDVVSNMASQKD